MDLHRSTLLDGGVSGDASLTPKEVITDLKSLNWQDCHVTSLITYGAAGTPPSSTVDLAAFSLKRKKPRRSGKKGKKLAAVEVDGDNSAVSTNGTIIVAGSTTERSVACWFLGFGLLLEASALFSLLVLLNYLREGTTVIAVVDFALCILHWLLFYSMKKVFCLDLFQNRIIHSPSRLKYDSFSRY